jgi:AcrR family transcriptional regulator
MKLLSSTSRHQERSEATRNRLLRAAEKIFARDGFEAAKLEEIAAQAGYTRGAFYANFKSKEDLFLALLEGEISARIEHIENLMKTARAPGEKRKLLREFLLTVAQDRRWSLISLEFKLFAVRHPEAKARLAAMNRRLVHPRVSILHAIMEGSRTRLPISASAIAVSLSSAANVLALEHMLDRAVLSQTALRTVLGSYFDCLTGRADPTNGRASRTRTLR